MAPCIGFASVASAMCMIGIAEGFSIPHAVNRNGAGERIRFGSEQEVPRVVQSDMETGTSASSVNPLLFGMIVGLAAAFVATSTPAFADGDAAAGEGIFSAQCAGCHKGGGNVLAKEKTLTKDALQANSKYEISLIAEQVAGGKASMPAFGQKISPADVENVAAYVRAQADKGW